MLFILKYILPHIQINYFNWNKHNKLLLLQKYFKMYIKLLWLVTHLRQL